MSDESSKFQFQVDRESSLEKFESERNLFVHLFSSSPVGLKVLGAILVNFCHFGQYLDPEDKAQIGAYNVGIDIMRMCKMFDNKRMLDVINSMVAIVPPKEEE